MDLALEICDTLFFDKAYAKLFPKTQQWPVALVKLLGLQTCPANDMFPRDILEAPAAGINGSSLLTSGETFPNMLHAATQHIYGEKSFLMTPTGYAVGSVFARTNWIRQLINLTTITCVFGFILYVATAGLSYYLVYDKETMKHPKFLKNQISMEIKQALSADRKSVV